MSAKKQEKNKPFRVVIVGAGIAGLTLSNALQQAGIDHVVLEKHSQVVYPSGASIGIWPHAGRLLSQMGSLQFVQDKCAPMQTFYSRLDDGRVIGTSKLFDEIVKRHGYAFHLLERTEFIRALYDGLPSTAPIKTGSAVTAIESSAKGVRVHLANGLFEDGDMVVGCDGVNSAVRQIMWDTANAAVPGAISLEEMSTFTTRYKCLFGLSPAVPGLPSGLMTVVHLDKSSFLVLTQPTRVFYFLFTLLDRTYHWPDLPTYTAADADVDAARVADVSVHEGVRFGTLWQSRLRGGLVNIEEGIHAHWHAGGRIVLVGDAAHKFTVNVALGGNAAMDSAAVLANRLQAALAENAHPGPPELAHVFAAYQDNRHAAAKDLASFCTLLTRAQACETAWFRFLALRVMPRMSDALVGSLFSQHVKRGAKLDYLPVVDQPHGTVSFEDERTSARPSRTAVVLLSLATLAAGYAVSKL